MDMCHFFIILIFLSSSKADGSECNSSARIPDPSNCTRYQKCLDGKWMTNYCSSGNSFDPLRKICVLGGCNQNNSSEFFTTSNYTIQIKNGTKEAVDQKIIKNHRLLKRGTYRRNIMQTIHTTYKSFRSSTHTIGDVSKTTLWYYNTEGPNYKFSLDGVLPAPRKQMISWIENNSYKYLLTRVPYEGDAVEGSDTFRLPNPGGQEPLEFMPVYIPEPVVYMPQPEILPEQPELMPEPQKNTPKPEKLPETLDEILPENCGQSRLSSKSSFDKVGGGKDVSIEDFPWQVALVDSNTRNLACGGSIITLKHILTASHCFFKEVVSVMPDGQRVSTYKSLPKSTYLVSAGSSLLNDEFTYEIQDLYLHIKYEGTHKRNDIALILIYGYFDWSTKIYPICLPERNTEYYGIERICQVSGWGSSSEHSENAKYLNSADVGIVERENCKRENQKFLNVTSGMFCAGDYERGSVDSCRGDSGGPCTCHENGRLTLFGITSWGIGCRRAKHPGVYTRVSIYRVWIDYHLVESMKKLQVL